MSRYEIVELTVLCLVYNQEAYLLQNRVKKDWQGYTLPGGHVETNESIVDAVVREMQEETGLTIQNPKLCGIKQFPIENGRYLVFLFKTNQYYGNLLSSEEGEMVWVKKDEISKLKLVDDFTELLQVITEDSLTEFQYKVNGKDWQVILK